MNECIPAPRVVVLISGGLSPVSGGVGTLMRYLAQAWSAGETPPCLHVIDTRGAGGRLAGALCFVRATASLLGLLAARRADLVHAHMTTRGSVLRKFILCSLAATLRTRVILHLHGADFLPFYRRLPAPVRPMVHVMFRRAWRVVVLGESWRRLLTEEIGLHPDRVVLVPNGVPRARQMPVPRRAGPPHILFLGRIGARKGVPDLIAALATPDLAARAWRATIAGDGEVEACRADIDRHGLGARVIAPGWADRDGTDRLLAQADILVLPSHHEATPMAVLEALAAGIAVITTPVGTIGDFLTNGVNARLVAPGDVPGLAAALALLIDDPAERRRLAEAGHDVFARQFDITLTASRILALYREGARRSAACAALPPSPSPLPPEGGGRGFFLCLSGGAHRELRDSFVPVVSPWFGFSSADGTTGRSCSPPWAVTKRILFNARCQK